MSSKQWKFSYFNEWVLCIIIYKSSAHRKTPGSQNNPLCPPLTRGDLVGCVSAFSAPFALNYYNYYNLMYRISIFCDSPLKRGDKGVCKFAATHTPSPLSRGELKSRCRRQPNS